MDEDLIKSVQKTPIVRDALKKNEQEPPAKTKLKKKPKTKKDPKRIIDTYV
ncbi:MAG: hypothetical protein OEY09_07015 [Gammaproteobacteria bacterium]|nr:hypothetical protein [Gammaproteobacteria bacterium]